MDLSKLPRLSKTEPPAGDAAPLAAPAGNAPPGARGAFCDQCGAALRTGARFCDSCGTATSAAGRETTGAVPTPGLGYAPTAPPSDGGGLAIDIWISIIIGLLFLFLGWDYARYTGSRIFHTPYHTGIVWNEGPKANQEVAVSELEPEKRAAFDQQMMTSGALLFFACSLLIDGLVRVLAWARVPGGRAFVAIGLCITLFALCYNLYVCMRLLKAGVTPLLSLICVAFGGYIAFSQWMTFQMMGQAPARPAPPGA